MNNFPNFLRSSNGFLAPGGFVPQGGAGGGMGAGAAGGYVGARAGVGTFPAGVAQGGMLVVGTAESVRAVWSQMVEMGGGVVHLGGLAPVGCILVDTGARAAERGPWAGVGPVAGMFGVGGGGLAVLGGVDALEDVVRRWDVRVAVVTMPRAMAGVLARVRAVLRRLSVAERFVPTLTDMLASDGGLGGAGERRTGSLGAIGSVGPGMGAGWGGGIDPVELIGRTPYGLDRKAVGRVLTGRRVLITGAGGSIGSELARVAAGFRPELIVLMERSENALFEIDRQIARHFPDVGRRALLHDVTDAAQTLRHLEQVRPHVVFHAAAHKHVPIMEDHPSAAVINNVAGTRAIVDASIACGVERFVMISSDKAVNPTSVMGATKRMAELYVRAAAARQAVGGGAMKRARGTAGATRGGKRAAQAGTRCAIVRFGNVLGSACSVLPIWSAQIGEGGPVTVTDPRMTRYFMTIPEAATLVVQAAAMDWGSESAPARARTGGEGGRAKGRAAKDVIGRAGSGAGKSGASTFAHAGAGGLARTPVFVLEMGEPVRILDLALRFVRAHGLEPRVRGETALAVGSAPRFAEPPAGIAALDVVFTGARPGEKLHEQLAYSAERLAPTSHPGINAWSETHAESGSAIDAARMARDIEQVQSGTDRCAVMQLIRSWVPEMRTSTAEAA